MEQIKVISGSQRKLSSYKSIEISCSCSPVQESYVPGTSLPVKALHKGNKGLLKYICLKKYKMFGIIICI